MARLVNARQASCASGENKAVCTPRSQDVLLVAQDGCWSYDRPPTPALGHIGGGELSGGRASALASQFVAKMGVVIEEADESVFWLELLADSGIVPKTRLDELTVEANELVAIFVASQKTAKAK